MQSNIFKDSSITERRKTTADATPVVSHSINMSEGQAVKISAQVLAKNSDETVLADFTVHGTFYRSTAGDVTQLNYQSSLPENKTDDGLAFDFVADTVSQQIDVQLTGIAATSIKWYIRTEHYILS
jgi:hypothetical protein